MNAIKSIPFSAAASLEPAEMIARAQRFADTMAGRRTVRDFSERSVPREVIEACLRAAGFQASIFCSSPLASNFSTSSAPPTSVPLTNTIGKVGQPVHILSALRLRQVLK